MIYLATETFLFSLFPQSPKVLPVFSLQAVEWECDEATKKACYSKGKSKVRKTEGTGTPPYAGNCI